MVAARLSISTGILVSMSLFCLTGAGVVRQADQSIAGIAGRSDDFEILMKFIGLTDLGGGLADSASSAVTVFAPNDDAFIATAQVCLDRFCRSRLLPSR